MTTQDTSELLPLLEQAAQEGSTEGREILESAIEVLPSEGELTPAGTPFEVQVLLNSQGTIAVATTRKVPNLRFRLGEVLIEVVGYGIALPGKLQNPITTVLSTLSFLRSLNKLATITLDPGDAELLITIFRLTRDGEVLGLDRSPRARPRLAP